MELEGREAAGAGDSRLIDAAGPPAVLTGCLRCWRRPQLSARQATHGWQSR
jgi:hypothetical protein